MSSADVRAALFDYFSTAQIQGVRRVYKASPWWVDGNEWNFAIDQGSATVAFLHIAEENETRLTLPAVLGQKRVTYRVLFYILYQYLFPAGQTDGVSEDDWAAPLDATIDAVKDLIRADPNCGLPASIWQSGQDAADLKTQRDVPFIMADGGSLGSWSSITFTVEEIITA